jgi:hypothetical protein
MEVEKVFEKIPKPVKQWRKKDVKKFFDVIDFADKFDLFGFLLFLKKNVYINFLMNNRKRKRS